MLPTSPPLIYPFVQHKLLLRSEPFEHHRSLRLHQGKTIMDHYLVDCWKKGTNSFVILSSPLLWSPDNVLGNGYDSDLVSLFPSHFHSPSILPFSYSISLYSIHFLYISLSAHYSARIDDNNESDASAPAPLKLTSFNISMSSSPARHDQNFQTA